VTHWGKGDEDKQISFAWRVALVLEFAYYYCKVLSIVESFSSYWHLKFLILQKKGVQNGIGYIQRKSGEFSGV
jgi:hypothetical protein